MNPAGTLELLLFDFGRMDGKSWKEPDSLRLDLGRAQATFRIQLRKLSWG